MNRIFFQFAAAHSFLMGLLPFYIPVLLWQQDSSLTQISFFVALTGLGFLIALPLWQGYQRENRWSMILALSFGLEILLLGILLAMLFFFPADKMSPLLIPTALINGAYLCFYWTTQRTLFVMLTLPAANSEDGSSNETGKTFGNFQILVMVLLKIGILLGAFLLDQDNELILLALSLFIIALAMAAFNMNQQPMAKLSQASSMLSSFSLREELKGLSNRTKGIFLLDGIFLYLESYFWLLSLYLIAQQDVMKLGFIVVSLTLLLAGIFFIIKNKIDKAPAHKVFHIALVGYALSWVLRSFITESDTMVYPTILAIAFLTSFFRLSFNKRFFDYAHQQGEMSYLVLKSYLSQFSIFIFFLIIGLYGLITDLAITELSIIYGIIAPIALLYGFYGESDDHIEKNRFKKVTHA